MGSLNCSMELPGQSTSFATDECVICSENISDGRAICKVHEKGVTTMHAASKEKEESLRVIPGQILHSECRAHIHKQKIYCKCQEKEVSGKC